MTKKGWQHYSHPADMGIRGFGATKEEAFSQAALAMTAVITEPETIKPEQKVKIICDAADDDGVTFANWLNAVLYEMAVRNMLFSRFEVALKAGRLSGMAWGERLDISRHKPAVEVKAATYCDLKVRQLADGRWLAQCVVDV